MPVCSPKTFTNPNNKSLKNLHIEITGDDGAPCKISALDKYWVSRSNLTNYISLSIAGGKAKDGAALEEWIYVAENFQIDMEFLLSLPQNEFWSYLLYDKTTLTSIRSFLQNATPFYLDTLAFIPQKVSELYENVVNLMVRIICRMVTPKESTESWFEKDDLRELLYKKYILTIPMLLDLVMAVGDTEPENYEIFKRIFDTLLKIAPDYKQDIKMTLTFFKSAFRSIHTQTENEGCEGAGGGLLDEEYFETPFDDVALYTLDCSYTLDVLLRLLPLTRSLCFDIGVGQSIAHLYDNTLTALHQNISQINDKAISLGWLQQSRVNFLSAFRSITYSCVEAILLSPESSVKPAENFIGILTECLSEQAFVIDYEKFYPISCDMEIIKQACNQLDDFKANFVIEGYEEAVKSKPDRVLNDEMQEKPVEYCNNNNPNPDENSNETAMFNQETQTPCSNNDVENNNNRDIDLEISMILDCLPHLGTGFIRRVLNRYDNSEEAVAAILENNLPPDLQEADQSEVYIPDDIQDSLLKTTGIQHFNVHDGDAYDVMTQEKPQCIVKRGKGCPLDARNASELLDDKCDLAEIRHRYQEYALISESEDDDGSDRNYEDEYDDSYDALLDSESRIKKSEQYKNALAEVQDLSDDDNDDDSVDSDNSNGINGDDDADDGVNKVERKRNESTMNFCENPETIRARYESNYQNKFKVGRKGQQFKFNEGKSNSNVVGGPKGQGQSKEVLRNRQKKEAHKGTKANHNRKMAAAFKRSRGMY